MAEKIRQIQLKMTKCHNAYANGHISKIEYEELTSSLDNEFVQLTNNI